MASHRSTVDFLLEQMARAGPVAARKMFGEYALYCDGKTVALVCDDLLYLKPTPEARAFIGDVVEAMPFKGAKPWLLIDGDQWDDGDWLAALVRITAAALPAPVGKKEGRKSAPPRPERVRSGKAETK
jgi:DNA transformation protein